MTSEDLRARVEQVLTEKVRPLLQADGGDVELVDVGADGVVRVRLTGACGNCPLAGLTLAMSVERTLKENVPEVTRIQPVD